MELFFKIFLCIIASFLGSVIVYSYMDIGSLGEWAGAIVSGLAVWVALRGSRLILGAKFSFLKSPFFMEWTGVTKELIVTIENKSNFEVKIDNLTVLFKTRY
ncbi:hypothetical protein KIJ04_05185 [Leuconostoc gelidum subsp. gelidum]|uniref:hypothetical protein n=1 Tax=Leuconostoc gelidum TaxID=1244 RepID=UPI001CC6C2D0|nr:hypothetical protein [Leuconostoc gelidum]MBZ6014141.1 hypothetical protein [Leuconostoc gelidum subsp. gelidum]